jgi:hypothetical protein
MPIYESPDGGQTIYERLPGSSARELIKDNRTVDGRPLHEHIMESKMWGEIHRMAKTNPTIKHALDEVILLYQLSK